MDINPNENPTPIEQMTPYEPKRKSRKLIIGILTGVFLLLFAGYMGLWYMKGQSERSGSENVPKRAANVQPISPKNKLTTDPCKILTSAQLKEFSFKVSPSPMFDPERPDCGFNPIKGSIPGIVIVGTNWAGLQNLAEYYDTKTGFKMFEPTTILGYPAVYNEVAGHKADCRLSVETSDTQVLSVYVDIGKEAQDEACALAKRVAVAVIANLKQ